MTDNELIARVLAGDEGAERILYDTHVDRVFRLAYRLAGDAELAQDFTQETFVRAFSKLGEFQGRSALSTWLHAITVSVSLNALRKVKKIRQREVEMDDEDEPTYGSSTREAEPDLKTKLKKAIAALPDHYRSVFVMYDMEGYTHEEIGTVLGVPIGTSKARLSRAREKLREQLSEFAGEWA